MQIARLIEADTPPSEADVLAALMGDMRKMSESHGRTNPGSFSTKGIQAKLLVLGMCKEAFGDDEIGQLAGEFQRVVRGEYQGDADEIDCAKDCISDIVSDLDFELSKMIKVLSEEAA